MYNIYLQNLFRVTMEINQLLHQKNLEMSRKNLKMLKVLVSWFDFVDHYMKIVLLIKDLSVVTCGRAENLSARCMPVHVDACRSKRVHMY